MTRVNERIRAPQVRVVYQDINVVLPTKKALAKAKELGLDLVEIAAHADPPVCRIVDYGKYKYDQSKQKKEKPKSSTKVKEVKFRVGIEVNDYRIKLARAEDFLDHGNKLRVGLQFRGREMAHRELGFELMKRVIEDLHTMAKVDVEPKLSGRQISMMLSPLPDKQRVRKFKVEVPEDYVEEEFEPEDEEHEDEEHGGVSAEDDDAPDAGDGDPESAAPDAGEADEGDESPVSEESESPAKVQAAG